MKFFVTGSNGFVGKVLCTELSKRNISLVRGVRESKSREHVEAIYGDIDKQFYWEQFLTGSEVVVHLAARVHVMDENSEDPLLAFRKINCEATLNIAKAARQSGVKRFIYLSSVKVNGEQSVKPFKATDVPRPEDPYGISKMEAEKQLLALHQPGVFEVVIIRPPLVYGPGVKANFEKIFQIVQKNIPLPFALVKNKRSLVSVFNLVDLIIKTALHPDAGGKIFLVSDDDDLSLKELIQKMAKVSHTKSILIPVPVFLMETLFKVIGKSNYADRLFGNLQLDISETKRILGWKPPFTFEDTFSVRNILTK